VDRMKSVEFETPTVNEKGQVIARTKHSAEQFTEDLGKGFSLELIVIPAGSFQMGSRHNEGNTDEHPQHFVTIKSFLMGKYLITQGQWKVVMGKLPPCRFKGDNLPVERVSWNDAQKFCQRLSQQTGRDCHLPSETQWEYACRAWTVTPFSFGETLTSDFANYNGEHIFRDEPRGIYFHSTSEGGKYPPNAFGVYDMHGNLMEWCADNWLDDYRMSLRDGSDYQMIDNPYRVARGGSWHDTPELCRSAARMRIAHSDAEEYVGFRVVCNVI
jgi:formylglycine-generating enzyme required for sulfatase activity